MVDAQVSDVLPAHLEIVKYPPSMSITGPNTLTATGINLDPGFSQSFIVTAKIVDDIPDRTVVSNTAELSYDGNTLTTPPVETLVRHHTGGPALTKTASAATGVPGDEITYTIQVDNPQESALTNVVVRDAYDPETMSVIASSISHGGMLNANPAPPLVPSVNWTLASIPAHSSVVLSFKATLGAPATSPVDAVNQVFVDSYNEITPPQSITHSARTTIIQNVNIDASAGAGGSISGPGTTTLSKGGDKTYTFTPDEGYEISAVSVNGVALSGSELDAAIANASYSFTNVLSDSSIHVDFALKTYDVTHTTTNISFPPEKDGPDKATHGQEFSSILSAETSYTLPADITVKIGDQILDPSAYTYDSSTGEVIVPGVQVTGNIEIIATAVPQSIDLTIVASAGAGGSISRPGTSIVTMGTDESYTFTPDTGYRINAVIIDGVPLLGAALDTAIANGSYTFINLQDDATIHVDFALKTYDVTHTATNITFPAEKDGPDKATHGQEFITALTPNLGYKLPSSIEVKVDGVTLDPSSYSYDSVTGVVAIPGAQVTGEIEIIAVAKHTTFDLDADAGEGGSISDLGTTVVNFGSDKTYTFTPDEGYEISSIIINGVPLSGAELEEAIASGSYTFDDVQSDASIRVLFKLREVDEPSKSTTPTDTGSTDSTKTVSTPKKTGDSAQTGLLVALLVSGLAGLLFLMRQRSGK